MNRLDLSWIFTTDVKEYSIALVQISMMVIIVYVYSRSNWKPSDEVLMY